MNLNSTLFFQAIALFVAGWISMKFFWPMLRDKLDERRQKIADGLAAAEAGTKSLSDAKRKVGELEADARTHAQQIIAETEKRAQAMVDAAKDQAKVEADRLIAAAKAEADQQVVRAKTALRDQVAALAVSGAEAILKREIDPKAHAALLDQLKQQL
jgi:F-type H+-transporting ATPase subunit b